jgi:hypothetical protein
MLREEFDGNIVGINNRYVDERARLLRGRDRLRVGRRRWRRAERRDQDRVALRVQRGQRLGRSRDRPGADPLPRTGDVGPRDQAPRTCILAAMAGLDTMVFYRIDRDDEAIADMRECRGGSGRPRAAARAAGADHDGRREPPLQAPQRPPRRLDEEHARRCSICAQSARTQGAQGDQAELELKVAKFVCQAWGARRAREIRTARQRAHHPRGKDNAALQVGCAWAAARTSTSSASRPTSPRSCEYTVPHYYRTFRFPKS